MRKRGEGAPFGRLPNPEFQQVGNQEEGNTTRSVSERRLSPRRRLSPKQQESGIMMVGNSSKFPSSMLLFLVAKLVVLASQQAS